MPQTSQVADFLQIAYRTDTCLLTGRWLRTLAPDELRIGYQAILKAAQAHNCRYWLVDVRRRNACDATTTQWLLESFFPEVATQLCGRAYFSFLLSPTYLSESGEDPRIMSSSHSEKYNYRFERFDDERKANEWLTQNQTVSRPKSIPASYIVS